MSVLWLKRQLSWLHWLIGGSSCCGNDDATNKIMSGVNDDDNESCYCEPTIDDPGTDEEEEPMSVPGDEEEEQLGDISLLTGDDDGQWVTSPSTSTVDEEEDVVFSYFLILKQMCPMKEVSKSVDLSTVHHHRDKMAILRLSATIARRHATGECSTCHMQ